MEPWRSRFVFIGRISFEIFGKFFGRCLNNFKVLFLKELLKSLEERSKESLNYLSVKFPYRNFLRSPWRIFKRIFWRNCRSNCWRNPGWNHRLILDRTLDEFLWKSSKEFVVESVKKFQDKTLHVSLEEFVKNIWIIYWWNPWGNPSWKHWNA